jgi:hypothetical protein
MANVVAASDQDVRKHLTHQDLVERVEVPPLPRAAGHDRDLCQVVPSADPARLDRVVNDVVRPQLAHRDSADVRHSVTSWEVYDSFILSICELVDRGNP